MHRKEITLVFFVLAMTSPLVAFAQLSNDEQTAVSTPAPRAMTYCLARMINHNETLELTAVIKQDTGEVTHYDVSLPVLVNGKKAGYRTEQREATRKVTKFRYSYCELDASALDAYQSDGKRLNAEEVSEKLKPSDFTLHTPVVLADSPPDDLMTTVLAKDCIVFVVPDGGLKFRVRNDAKN